MAPLAASRAKPLRPESQSHGPVGDTATRILDATLATMADHGIARLSLEDVARRARLSRQTVYRYFPSKKELVDAAVLREEQVFLENMVAAAGRHRELEPALRAAIDAAMRTGQAHALLNRLLATEPNSMVALVTTDRGPVLSAAREARRGDPLRLAARRPQGPPRSGRRRRRPAPRQLRRQPAGRSAAAGGEPPGRAARAGPGTDRPVSAASGNRGEKVTTGPGQESDRLETRRPPPSRAGRSRSPPPRLPSRPRRTGGSSRTLCSRSTGVWPRPARCCGSSSSW